MSRDHASLVTEQDSALEKQTNKQTNTGNSGHRAVMGVGLPFTLQYVLNVAHITYSKYMTTANIFKVTMKNWENNII